MPFLSKIRINPLRQKGGLLVRNPHVAHGMISGGIAGNPTRERTLWRLDTADPRRPSLLVLTETKPDWSHIVDQAGWPHAEGEHFTIRDYSPLFTHLTLGHEFAFRVTAHPVENTINPNKPTPAQQKRRDNGNTRGFRLTHRTAAHQLDWFVRRTANWGFTIPSARRDHAAPGLDDTGTPAHDVRIVARNPQRFHKGPTRILVSLTAVTFEGRLAITDPTTFKQRLLDGIGPSKAYGCGLLTLAPLSR
ncbi:type I-E CRISPR-associated protein Cas6/Cse3/CasE [Actinosynnema sp. ALI-1.44]|uniref:type I-E CRISPR-associated protein Cas6/Cse3/CasE n=1 Tax=Actinosynnema sp. ALI-1.44 TaxID=1933779 RepID=UPI00097C5E79|nr:type I-E CRISPR-associated protein Cas6/Cse3/CasE [Actinosynnema sp. ALI-1.44]ONI91967.1 type I-E CRISPR-associated protein Cas6/Cse3/CasE [Actinosynnema sp. ALI-1.44]